MFIFSKKIFNFAKLFASEQSLKFDFKCLPCFASLQYLEDFVFAY